MKKIFLIPAFIVAFIIAILIFKSSNKSVKKTNKPVKNNYVYVVKAENGKVGVYKNNNTLPEYYLEDVVFATLPEYDKKLLTHGITAKSERELQSILEDYDS